MPQTLVRFKSLHPKKWSLQETVGEMKKELEAISIMGLALMRRTTATWKHKPTFRLQRRVYAGLVTDTVRLAIITDDEIFRYVDQGTAGHWITPKAARSARNPGRPSALKFQKNYKSKSTRGKLSSGPGGHYGPTVYRPGVWHPGIAPRYLMKALQVQLQYQMNARMPVAIKRGLARGIQQ